MKAKLVSVLSVLSFLASLTALAIASFYCGNVGRFEAHDRRLDANDASFRIHGNHFQKNDSQIRDLQYRADWIESKMAGKKEPPKQIVDRLESPEK